MLKILQKVKNLKQLKNLAKNKVLNTLFKN